ncbi:uncharacterized protein LOC107216933 isoform X1 [Neodiprion lecontei]|uniref:Uncharacterized protein LOC107216933 isoform X1 n=1 Tax=Neodiprion lecontei TaxID=441921 RepID=A0A6J0B6G3_NEOLC|nr:uncharacterized protein LOC107216933 isoform X1 [Neodiprion lecontei]
MRRYNRKLELQVFGPFPIRLDFTGIHHTRPIHDSLFLPEDEVVVIEHLPGRRVHLQDFFWTGADDAPPWLNPDQTLTLYEPRTVHHTATVYLPADGKGEDDDQGCANCIDPTPTLSDVDQDIGILIGDDPGPRYWLLTVLRAGETVPPRVELRLARLYKAAFSRQQKQHLGILSHSARLRRAAWRITRRDNRQKRDGQRGISKTESQVKASMSPESLLESGQAATKNIDPASETVKVKHMRAVKIPRRNSVILDTDNESDYLDVAKDRHDPQQLANKIPITSNLARPVSHDATVPPSGEQNPINNSTLSHFLNTSTIHTRHEQTSRSQEINFEKDANSSEPFEATQAKLRNLEVGKVQVMMQNMSLTEDGATRLIYSVHLGGEPVPAASAARDMALLSEQEVALELGAPVIIQSEPYLKETRPLALSRRRDAWVLIGAAAAALMILIVVFIGLIFLAKRKRAQSAVAAPPPESILKRQTDYVSDTPGLDNTGYTSETEQRTEGTSQRLSAGSRHGSPLTPGTPESVVADIHQDLTDEEEEEVEELKARSLTPWGGQEYAAVLKRQRPGRRRVTQTNAVDHPRTPDSMDVADALTTLENGHIPQKSNPKEDLTTSPHSYLSMPSCKQFPRIRSVEPLSRVLEPVVVRHLDMEFDSPEMQRKNDDFERGDNETYLIRSSSVMNDPGVVGPIVWDLRRQKAVEETTCSETDMEQRIPTITAPVGRARRRLHELLEDSFTLFGNREAKPKDSAPHRPPSRLPSPEYIKMPSENRGKSATVSPVATPASETKTRPRTSLPRRGLEVDIPETGVSGPHPRGAWGSRPLSAGPFHRPNLPEVDTVRVLADARLPPEDPAMPLIAAIKKELEKFAPNSH